VLIIDISLARTYSYSFTSQFSPSFRVTIFLALGVVYIIGQYILLQFTKNKSKDIRSKGQLHLSLIHKAVIIIQCVLAAVIVFFIVEMVLTSSYSVVVLATAIGISYTLSIILLGLLSKRFFSWFKSNRNSVVLLYGLSSAMLAINAASTVAFVDTVLLSLSQGYVYPHPAGIFVPFITSGPLTIVLNYVYSISSVISFMLSWIATILILRHYSPKLGKVKLWIVLGFPLGYFLVQFLPLFPNVISFLSQSDILLFFYSLIPGYSKVAGAILFGLAFWMVARNLGQKNIVKEYMVMSAYSLVLLFASNQAILLVDSPYPPFGLVTTSFMGLASYLVMVGIYSSAICLSQDSTLRQHIRKFAEKESRLLDSIGTAQMEQEIQQMVIKFTKQNQDKMAEKSGVYSSLTEDDVKVYLEQVIKEVRKNHNKKP
jgi:DNA-binding protein Fis